jgi:hypothetical protein
MLLLTCAPGFRQGRELRPLERRSRLTTNSCSSPPTSAAHKYSPVYPGLLLTAKIPDYKLFDLDNSHQVGQVDCVLRSFDTLLMITEAIWTVNA